MANKFSEVEKQINNVEQKAWQTLDDFFLKTNGDIDKAKIAVGTLAIIIKRQSLELLERKLIKP